MPTGLARHVVLGLIGYVRRTCALPYIMCMRATNLLRAWRQSIGLELPRHAHERNLLLVLLELPPQLRDFCIDR